jgi:hypothetical protein
MLTTLPVPKWQLFPDNYILVRVTYQVDMPSFARSLILKPVVIPLVDKSMSRSLAYFARSIYLFPVPSIDSQLIDLEYFLLRYTRVTFGE